MIKKALTILASFGIAIVALSVPFAFSSTEAYLNAPDIIWNSHFPGETGLGFVLTFLFGFFGVVLALVGGLIARPRGMWIPLILIGLLYCLSFVGSFYNTYKQLAHPQAWPQTNYSNYIFDGILVLPGLALIAEGIVIRKLKIKH